MCRNQYWPNQDLEEIFIGSVCCHPFSDSFFPGGMFHPTTLGNWTEMPYGIKGAEQAGGVCGGGQRRHPWVGVRNPRWSVLLLEAAMETFLEDIRAKREGPLITNNNDKYVNNDINNDGKRPYDNLCDGVEDTNQNGRIDGDNGDGIYGESETWEETSPNLKDSDGDTFSDKDEKDWEYNPLSTDTDNDGILDNDEDSNSNGILDSSETDPTEMDTDGDGLFDKQELDGWTVVIIKESTGEQDSRYNVVSDPRDVDSDDDQIDDYSEFKNATDPTKEDTDGDGKSDYIEIEVYEDSSPWGIDGVPPNITKIEKDYKMRYGGWGGLKLVGVDVELTISCRDDFGIRWLKVHLDGVGEEIIHFNDALKVKHTFSFTTDNYARILWSGFDLNISASDRNNNVGFKESEVKGIIKAAFDALVGALLSFAKVLMELISKLCNWLYELPKKILDGIMHGIEKVKQGIQNVIDSIIKPIFDFIKNNKGNIENAIEDFMDKLLHLSLFILVGSLMIALAVVEIIVMGVTFGATGIISAIVAIVLGILAAVLLACDETREAIFGIVTDIYDKAMEKYNDDTVNLFINIFKVINGFVGTIIKVLHLEMFGIFFGYEVTEDSAKSAFGIGAIIKIAGAAWAYWRAFAFTILSAICSWLSIVYHNRRDLHIAIAVEALIFKVLALICSICAMYFKTIPKEDNITPWQIMVNNWGATIMAGFSVVGLITWSVEFVQEYIIW